MKCLGSALLPPCSMCSHRDRDESQHLAAGCTSCSKHRLCELGCERSRPRDSLLSAVFLKLPLCCLPLPSADVVHNRAFCFIVSGAFQNKSSGGRAWTLRNGIRVHPAKGLRDASWFPDSPCHCSSGNICEFSLQSLDSSCSHGDREGDSLGSSNRASPADV